VPRVFPALLPKRDNRESVVWYARSDRTDRAM